MGFSATAQAQTDVLSATLTVKDLGTSQVGCANTTPSARCSDFLSEDEFTYDSTDYAVTDLFVRPSGSLVLGFNADLTTAAQTLTLDVAGTTFAFEDAETKTTAVRIWSNSGLSWSVDDPVVVKLVEPAPTVPGAPVLTATANGETQIDLSWTVPDTGGRALDKYSIDVSADGGTTWSPLADTSATITTYSHTGLTAGTTRHYRVAAVNPIGTGAWSNVDSATTTAAVANTPATGSPVITGTAQVGQSLYASLGSVADADGPSNIVASYQWIRVDGATETDITGATITPYTPVADDVGKQLKVRLSFTDDLGNPESRTSAATQAVLAAAGANNAPVFTEGTSTTRSVAENTASSQNIGTAIAATDADSGDTLRYTLGGTDMASFAIVSTSGQLQTQAALDYETKSSYAVTVSVSDGNGGSDSISVTITVTDVNEQPTLTIDVDPNRFSEDAGSVQICVVPSAPSTQRITVQVATADGTATAPGDYVSYSSTVALQPQQQRACFTVTLVDDAEAEGDETFTVRLSNPVNATLGGARAVATFTIVDNDDTTVATDRAALVAFYNATGGANWTFNANWLSNEPLSAWHGVETNAAGRVTFLGLPHFQLNGEIPAELGNLDNLQTLSLFGNQLSGEIPAELGQLINLQGLHLYENTLSGEIPAELGNLANLQALSLYGNQLSGEIPAELGNLANLVDLYLSQNTLSGEIPVELGGLTDLVDLYLWGNELSGEIPAELGGLTSLQRLELARNTLSGEIPVELGDLASLKVLALFSNMLTGGIPVELGNLANLEVLYLWGNQLDGEIPVELGNLANLQRLSLRGNQLDGEIPEELGSLANLEELYLNDNQLSGEIPEELGNLGSLQVLSLSRNTLSGEIPEELGSLANLEELYLNDNQLSGEIPEELGNLGSLQVLSLSRNTLSGEIPEELGDLTSLYTLYLHNNQLSGAIPNFLATLSNNNLLRLSLYGNAGLYGYPTGLHSNLRLLAPGNGDAICLPSTMGGSDCTIPTLVDKLRVTSSPTQLVFTWAPNPDGYSGGYSAQYYPPPSGPWTDVAVTGTTATLTGLTPEATYSFLVRTVDNSTTPRLYYIATLPARPPTGSGGGGGGGGGPRTSAPGAVRNLMVAGGNGQVVLTWRAPSSDGGAAITDYEYRINRRNPWISTGSTETTHTVTGLDNGTAYTFEVRAVNRIGRGRASSQTEATPVAPEVFTLGFAHFANGDGLTSDLVFVNVSTQWNRLALYFYDTEGNPIAAESVVDVTGDLEVQEDGGLTILTEMEPLGELTISTHGRGDLVSGSVKVVSGAPIGGMLRFDLPHVGVAVVGASLPISDALFPVRRQEGGINTGVAIHNLEEEAIVVSCRLMQEGTVLEEVEIPLEVNGQTSWLIDQAFPGTDTSDFVGSVRCDAPGRRPFAGLALEMDPGTRIFTTLPVVSADRTGGGGAAVLDFAHFVNGDGTTSDLVFVNVSTQRSRPAPTPFHSDIPPIRPAIYFYDTQGNPIAAESVVEVTGDLEIQEDGALTVRTEMEPLGVLTVSTHGRGALVTGSVKVVSEGSIGAMLRYDLPHIGEAVVGASPPIGDAIFPVRRQEGGITTGVAIHNLESSPGLVHCDLLREGVLLDAVSIPLEANGQTSWLIDTAFPNTDTSEFMGSVRCDAVGEGLFSAVALEMDPGTRIFTTLPVVPVPERMSQE